MKGITMNRGQSLRPISAHNIPRALCIIFCLALAGGMAGKARGQGQIASGTISGSGTGPYTYNLTFSDAAGALSPVGSVWYGWVPGQFFLPGTPTGASAPSGWSATISGNSIQFVASSSANDIAAGHSLSGFSYQASFSPTQLAAAPNANESVAYSAGLFSDGGYTFTAQIVAAPEPSVLSLLLAGSFALIVAARRKLRVA
jgi:hypothetical protein